MKNIMTLMRYAWPYKKSMVVAIGAMLAQVFIGFYIPYIMKDIIDVALPNQALDQIIVLSLLMLAFALFGMVCGVINTYSSQYISQHASAELRLDLFKKIQTLSFKNIDDFTVSRLITNATNDVVRVQMFFTMMLRIIIRAPLMIVMGLFLAISTSLQLSGVFFITIPLLLIAIIIIMKFAYPRFKKVQTALDGLNNVVLENANAPQVVKSFVSQDYETEKFLVQNENYRQVNTSAETVLATADPAINMIFNLGIALILLFGAYYFSIAHPAFFIDNMPRIGLIMMFNSYSQQILIGLMMFAMMMIFVSRADVSAARINEIFNAIVDLEDAIDAEAYDVRGKIHFRDVSFGYGEDGNMVLNNLNFTINKGESIGIIGSTGSGKSTMVSLIPRLYDVTRGAIYLDDKPLKNITLQSLRKSIGYVTQEAIIFSGSVGTNILQGNEVADLATLEESSRHALIHDFIEQQDAYFNYLIKTKGTNLSGGQKQRISIARALIRRPSIVILDDATSAVDYMSEKKILQTMTQLDYHPTLLCISQKVATVRRMNRIMVLRNDGTIDGFGTHDDLMNSSPVYQEIVRSQLNVGGDSHA